MSALARDYPWHHAFLLWHSGQIRRYSGRVRVELWAAAREWVCKDIRRSK